ncbi:YciI family protein [Planococcus sp. N028]|uniref:YciI family protein n=1 Tax=Planococcus shixiaomingii TaxID=3058393 RepID=A0ABT8N1L1_9BACL|nr:YciI family protein [Planococcus sp. N028]MDN7241613.1 YciI family protein [Planococcus sp. N028]
MAQTEDKKFFAVFLPMLDAEKSQQFRTDHLGFLREMREAGHVYGNGRFVDGAGGLVIYLAASHYECESLVKQDPYIKNGARLYEIHEWEAVWTTS